MIELASHILESKSGLFDASKFKDEYELALKKLVKKKASGKVIERKEPEEKDSNVVSLMDGLKQSLGNSKGGTSSKPKAKAKKAKASKARTSTRKAS